MAGGEGRPHEAGAPADKFFGKYRGTVMNNIDPLNRGRIQALVPAVLGEIPSGWALPCAPYAGMNAGFFSVPPVGAGVWIEFEGGDPSLPIWSGAWWATGEVPMDQTAMMAQPTTKIWRSDTGLLVALDDIKQSITLSDSAGMNLATIDVLTGTITVKAVGRVVLEAPLIQHGQGASHPAVFGDQLLMYLNQLVTMLISHVHPGQLAAGFIPVTPAPPVPPFPLPTPSLLSVKVLVE
jgi:hypothetical protein